MEWMFMPLKRYAEFSGRSRRMEYWMFILFTTIVAVVLMGPGLVSMIGASVEDPLLAEIDPFAGVSTVGLAGFGLYGLFLLAVLIPSVAVTVRRLHDRDMSGWWYLGFILGGMIPLVGFIASIAFIVILALPGTDGPNRFGPDPLDPHSTDVFE